LISCDSNNDTNNESNESLSIEDGKNQLEDNSIALLNKIEDFKNDQALNDIIELAEFLSSTNTSKLSGFKKTSFNTISNISKTLNNDNDFTTFSAKQAITLISGTPLNDDYNAEKGVYQWNNETDEFEKIGESEDVIYNID